MVFVAVAVAGQRGRRPRRAAHPAGGAGGGRGRDCSCTIAGSVLRGEAALTALLERVREAFGMDVGRRCWSAPTRRSPAVDVAAGRVGRRQTRAAARTTATTEVPVGDRLALVLAGRPLPAEDRRVLGAFAAQAAVALEQPRLTEAAAAAAPLADADRLRTALLAAVGHDLRTPLASAKAAVTSLRGDDVEWSPAEQAELLATADESLDRLAHLVDNLLDLSPAAGRRRSTSCARPFGLDEVVALALDELGDEAAAGPRRRAARAAATSVADPALLERIVANLVVERAAALARPARRRAVTASALGDVRRAAGRRPRARHPAAGPRAGVRAVPAARRHRQHDRRRARAGPVARAGRGDGRHARPRGHPRRRPDHGRHPADRPTHATSARTLRGR